MVGKGDGNGHSLVPCGSAPSLALPMLDCSDVKINSRAKGKGQNFATVRVQQGHRSSS